MTQPEEAAKPGAGLSENLLRYLRTGLYDAEAPDGFAIFLLSHPDDREHLRAKWAEVRDDLMAAHVKAYPGTRPWAWWELDAPRPTTRPVREPEWVFARRVDGRRQIGGSGQPMHEKYRAYLPRYTFGIPTMAECDPGDPPQFEAEASYLKRHDLLLPGEEQRLKPEDFEPEVLPVDDTDEDAPRASAERQRTEGKKDNDP